MHLIGMTLSKFFFILLELFAIFCQMFTFYNMYLYWQIFFTSFSGLFHLFIMQINCLFMGISILMFTHICILLTALGIVLTAIFFIKFDQIFQLLRHPRMQPVTSEFLCQIARLNRKNFLIFNQMNDVYGKMFSFNLFINCPINAHLMISMINTPMSFFSIFFIGAFSFQQMASIFGLHLLGAHFSLKIHQTAKPIATLFVKVRQFPSLQRKLKLAHYIFDFHNNNKYGAFYWGGVALMTMFVFLKVYIYCFVSMYIVQKYNIDFYFNLFLVSFIVWRISYVYV